MAGELPLVNGTAWSTVVGEPTSSEAHHEPNPYAFSGIPVDENGQPLPTTGEKFGPRGGEAGYQAFLERRNAETERLRGIARSYQEPEDNDFGYLIED